LQDFKGIGTVFFKTAVIPIPAAYGHFSYRIWASETGLRWTSRLCQLFEELDAKDRYGGIWAYFP